MQDIATVSGLLRPLDYRQMRCYPVSSRVNQPQNDDEECSREIQLDEPQQGTLFT